MTDPVVQRRPGYRVPLIVLFALVTAVISSVSARLSADVAEWWRVDGIPYLAATAVMLVLSSVLITALPRAVKEFWQWSGPFPAVADRVLKALGRPPKAVGVVSTILVLGLGSYVLLPPPLESGELVIMTASDLSPRDPRTTLIEQWNESHPRNRARFEPAAGETEEQHERMAGDAKPDGAHKADVYLLDVVWMSEFIDNDYLRELDQSKLAGSLGDFVAPARRTCEVGDKMWALPLNTDVGLIYHRTDIPNITPPTNWDGHSGIPAAEARGGLESANIAQFSDEMLMVEALEAIWAAGGEVVTKDGKVTLTPDESRVRFTKNDYEGMRKLNAETRTPGVALSDPPPENTTSLDAVEQFAKGRTAFMRNWAVAHEQLTNRQDELDAAGVTFRAAVPPTASVLGGQNLAVSARTDKPKAAQALIQFLTSAQSQQILAEIGGFAPTRDSVYDRAQGEHLVQVRRALQDAGLRPTNRNYTEFSRAFRNAVKGVVTTQDVISDDTARELAEILRK
ncbi:extracellular solute-binding protein [Umezawaea endophytica]|uniref:Extracellular solute-binding protein n=1 Tax=Umezawaea endophytica TaxID=1654476 RepID=A0A9X2VYA3_9PSEU|nr:extracellular solute-binding protein [Umezawaea endophytica]MCS7484856.1 extracellular solute-binding protein [Umezawaea endophytica]